MTIRQILWAYRAAVLSMLIACVVAVLTSYVMFTITHGLPFDWITR